jgi:hypothetical protein
MIVPQQAAKTLPTMDVTRRLADFVARIEDRVVQRLVVSFAVIR